jgi:hypothetical protein
MKHLITLICICQVLYNFAQTDTINKPLTYSEVIKVDSAVTKAQLYLRAKRAISQLYKSGKDVTEIDDKDAGQITAKGWFGVIRYEMFNTTFDFGKVWFELTITVKDGRYKYILTNFRHEGLKYGQGTTPDFGIITNNPKCPDGIEVPLANEKWLNRQWNGLQTQSQDEMKRIIPGIKQLMAEPLAAENQDW